MRDDANPTPWLSRKHWRRLVHLHAEGRIDAGELARLKATLTRVRSGPPRAPATPRRAPRLTLVPGGGRAREASRPFRSLTLVETHS